MDVEKPIAAGAAADAQPATAPLSGLSCYCSAAAAAMVAVAESSAAMAAAAAVAVDAAETTAVSG